jgi:hypothetical protein
MVVKSDATVVVVTEDITGKGLLSPRPIFATHIMLIKDMAMAGKN